MVADGRHLAGSVEVDSEQLEIDLARELFGQTDEPHPVTRTTYHRHQSWRTGVLLHQKPACPHITGRSTLRKRTIELSPDSSETIDQLCWHCLTTRPGAHRDALSRCLLRELVDQYPAGDIERVGLLAGQLDRHSGTSLATLTSHRQPLPISRILLDQLSLTASRTPSAGILAELARLVPAAADSGDLQATADQLTVAAARRQEPIIADATARWWPDVPTRTLSTLPVDTTPEHPTHQSDPYRELHGRWHTLVARLLAEQAVVRRDHIRRRQTRRRPVEILTVDINLASSDEAAEVGIPAALIVSLQQTRTRWGELVGVWRTIAVAAELAEPSDQLTIIETQPTLTSAPAELAQAAMRLARSGHRAADAVELAHATLGPTIPVLRRS